VEEDELNETPAEHEWVRAHQSKCEHELQKHNIGVRRHYEILWKPGHGVAKESPVEPVVVELKSACPPIAEGVEGHHEVSLVRWREEKEESRR